MIRSSNPVGALFDGRAAGREILRQTSAVRPGIFLLISALLFLATTGGTSWASASPQAAQPPEESVSQFGAINPYLGLTIDEIDMPGVPQEEAAALIALTPLKVGDPLTRDNLRDAMQGLVRHGPLCRHSGRSQSHSDGRHPAAL